MPPPFLRRGVWEAPYSGSAGETIVFAVSSQAMEITRILVPNPHFLPEVKRLLRRILDDADPPLSRRKKLRLVR